MFFAFPLGQGGPCFTRWMRLGVQEANPLLGKLSASSGTPIAHYVRNGEPLSSVTLTRATFSDRRRLKNDPALRSDHRIRGRRGVAPECGYMGQTVINNVRRAGAYGNPQKAKSLFGEPLCSRRLPFSKGEGLKKILRFCGGSHDLISQN